MSAPKKITNPFPGLRPFETDEYRLFFGREGQSDALLERLGRAHFLAVVGTSGSGKSSLVRAGMLPALRGGMMAGAGAGWRITVTRPGNDPFGELARALGRPDVLPGAGGGLPPAEGLAVIEATLRGGSLGLVSAARAARLAGHEKLLVVVDQFEELFRFRAARPASSAGDDASAFVKLLLEAARQRELNIYVVLTMRSDFLGDCSQFQGLPEAINDGQYLIPRMTRDERRVAITGPVGVTRGKMTEPLVNRLLNDVGDNPDQLPILQHALMRTWDYWAAHRRVGREPVGLEHYEAIGTMTDALSLHADEAWDELPDDRPRRIAELLFKALTERGADNREIRRPTRLSEICAITGASPDEVRAVVEVFRREGRSFLMPPAGTPLEAETVIDISHESLIRNWVRLKEWVRDEADAARIYRRLADAATAYRTGEGGLLDEVTLGWVLKWREKYHPNRAWGVRYHPEFDEAIAYLEESQKAHDAALAERERRQQEAAERDRRELELAQRHALQQRSAARRLRWLTSGMAVIFLLSLATAAYALAAKRDADRERSRVAHALTAAEAARKEADRQRKELAVALEEKNRQETARVRAEEEQRRAEEAEDAALKTALAEKERAQKEAARANEQARLAAARLSEAVAARKKALDAEAEAKRSLIALSTARANDHLNRDAVAMFQRGNVAEAEKAFENLTNIYSDDPSSLAWAKSNLGAARRQLGKLDQSIEDLKAAQAIQQEAIAARIRNRDNPEYLDTITWLGHAHRDKGEYELAQPLYAEALGIRRGVSKQADIAVSLENMARNYNNLGDAEEAAKLYAEALAFRRRNPGSPDLISTLKEIAEFYMEQGRQGIPVAVRLYEEALSNQEAYLEPYDPNIADTFNSLAQVYEETPFKGRAKHYNKLAREIRRSGLTRNGSNGSAMEFLANMYATAGRYKQAARLRDRAQGIDARQPGAEDRGPVNSLISLGDFFGEAAESATLADDRKAFYERAAATYGRALEISGRKAYPLEEGRALDGLARLHLGQKSFAEAERLYKRVLDMRERKLTSQVSPEEEMLENFKGLAESAVGLGKYAEAEAHLLRALKVFDGVNHSMMKIRGFDPPFVRHSMSARLAEVYHRQGRLKEADETYRPLAGRLKNDVGRTFYASGINAENYLYVVESAGRFYSERGDTAAAESFYLLVWPREIRPTVLTLVVWPEAYSKSLMEAAPVSSAETIIRILESYSALLTKAGRAREADTISHGIGRMRTRLLAEGLGPELGSGQGSESEPQP